MVKYVAMNKKPISIKEIAKLTGYSTATVSNVINQKGRVSEETAKKIRDVIQTYGYVGNSAAKSLRSSTTQTIGLIVPNIRNEFFAEVAACVEEWFYDKNYSVYICNTSNHTEREISYYRQLAYQHVDGILCISSLKMITEEMIASDIPLVLLDRQPMNTMDLPSVMNDDADGIARATSILIAKGCRHFLYFNSRTSQYSRNPRQDAFVKTLNDHGIAIPSSRLLKMDSETASNEQAEGMLLEFLKTREPVDAIVCASDHSALGVLAGLRREGIRVPQDVKVFGFDNTYSSTISYPTLSTIGRHTQQLAEAACKKLYRRIMNEPDPEPKHVLLPVDVLERESTAS